MIESRNSVPFNGVLGSPPKWFPEIHAKEFTRLRDQILNTPFYEKKITHEQVVAWMDEWRDMHQQDGVISHSVPIELQEIIRKLSQYRHAVSLGGIEGLRLLGGEKAVMGLSYSKEQSKHAKEPRKLTEEYKGNIRYQYTCAKNEGSVYGVFKRLARNYGVTEKTIHNVVKDLIKK